MHQSRTRYQTIGDTDADATPFCDRLLCRLKSIRVPDGEFFNTGKEMY
jgi:hypothetical protein